MATMSNQPRRDREAIATAHNEAEPNQAEGGSMLVAWMIPLLTVAMIFLAVIGWFWWTS